MSQDRRRFSLGSVFSWWALLLGLALGVTAALVFTWEIDPVVERNTAPWQLGDNGRESYVVAVALSYAKNGDLQQAFDRLRRLRPKTDVWQVVADVACDRVKTGKTVTNADIRVVRALEALYRPQGRTGCADGLYPTPAPVSFITLVPTVTRTPTLTPPPTKTATPPLPTSTPAASAILTTTMPPSARYTVTRVQSFCNPDAPGVIEVRVFDRTGDGVPGEPVTVTWSGDETDSFYTGLKAERDPGYADFTMEPGRTYSVVIPGLDGDAPSVKADQCSVTADGQATSVTISYWINFQQP